MSDEEKAVETNVHATNNSTAVGSVNVNGSIDGNVYIGGTHIHRDEANKPDLTSKTVETQPFEPETILILEGIFRMGSDPAEGILKHETPPHEIFLPAYRIGKCPVTNSEYEAFILETKTQVPPILGWDGQRHKEGMENHPVAGVTWYEALAYCSWLSAKTGRRYTLPSEAQWEKACRADRYTIYPWGDKFDPERCNQGRAALAAWDAYPPQNEYGCFDLVGNVRQWTTSLWGEKRIAPDPRFAYPWREDRRNDLNASRQIRRVIRGSSYAEAAADLRCSIRNGQAPEDAGWSGAGIGFRVVMIA